MRKGSHHSEESRQKMRVITDARRAACSRGGLACRGKKKKTHPRGPMSPEQRAAISRGRQAELARKKQEKQK